jgi:hypothetical protein
VVQLLANCKKESVERDGAQLEIAFLPSKLTKIYCFIYNFGKLLIDGQ